jgi:hypothetical protein
VIAPVGLPSTPSRRTSTQERRSAGAPVTCTARLWRRDHGDDRRRVGPEHLERRAQSHRVDAEIPETGETRPVDGVDYSLPPADGSADATLTLTEGRMLQMLGGDLTSSGIEVTGDPTVLQTILGAQDQGESAFNIVTP